MPLTDFVVADRADAQRVCESSCPSQDFDGVDAKGIDQVKLAMLYAVMTGTEYDRSFISGEPICERDEDGPWVFGIPDDLVRQLAALNATQIADTAAKWATIAEFSSKFEKWTPTMVHEALSDLAKMSAKAVAANKSVLMWMSL